MPPQEAQAWWADVEHLREDLERRRARREGRSPQPLRVVEGGGQGTSSHRRGPHGPLRVAPEPRERATAPPAARRRRAKAQEAPVASDQASGEHVPPAGKSRGEPGRFRPSAADEAQARAQHEPGPSLTELLRTRLEAGIAAVREPLTTREQRLADGRTPRQERLSEAPLHQPPPADPVQDARAQARRAARETFGDWSIAEPPAPGERRTIQIRGRQDDPPRLAGRRAGGHPDPIVRRPMPSARDRIDHRPDRIAAWAVALGFLLILMAAGTADAASLPLP
ncbi:MAG: hypothetical protein MSC31_06240 [Solirubrobacteraceae bacterium MAG38_C4-C5]|nr:hypothetical protein [Candidatus Siliceabacter maunaloa]